jgi:hypothetical protein
MATDGCRSMVIFLPYLLFSVHYFAVLPQRLQISHLRYFNVKNLFNLVVFILLISFDLTNSKCDESFIHVDEV